MALRGWPFTFSSSLIPFLCTGSLPPAPLPGWQLRASFCHPKKAWQGRTEHPLFQGQSLYGSQPEWGCRESRAEPSTGHVTSRLCSFQPRCPVVLCHAVMGTTQNRSVLNTSGFGVFLKKQKQTQKNSCYVGGTSHSRGHFKIKKIC